MRRSRNGRATISRISLSSGRHLTGPRQDARGKDTISGIDPFIMQADGKGWIFVPTGLQDGPLPTHYEPQESRDEESAVWPAVQSAAHGMDARKDNPYHRPYDDPRFPYRAHYLSLDGASHGGRHEPLAVRGFPNCSRRCSAKSRRNSPPNADLKNGGWATIRTARGGDRSARAGDAAACARCASMAG